MPDNFWTADPVVETAGKPSAEPEKWWESSPELPEYYAFLPEREQAMGPKDRSLASLTHMGTFGYTPYWRADQEAKNRGESDKGRSTPQYEAQRFALQKFYDETFENAPDAVKVLSVAGLPGAFSPAGAIGKAIGAAERPILTGAGLGAAGAGVWGYNAPQEPASDDWKARLASSLEAMPAGALFGAAGGAVAHALPKPPSSPADINAFLAGLPEAPPRPINPFSNVARAADVLHGQGRLLPSPEAAETKPTPTPQPSAPEAPVGSATPDAFDLVAPRQGQTEAVAAPTVAPEVAPPPATQSVQPDTWVVVSKQTGKPIFRTPDRRLAEGLKETLQSRLAEGPEIITERQWLDKYGPVTSATPATPEAPSAPEPIALRAIEPEGAVPPQPVTELPGAPAAIRDLLPPASMPDPFALLVQKSEARPVAPSRPIGPEPLRPVEAPPVDEEGVWKARLAEAPREIDPYALLLGRAPELLAPQRPETTIPKLDDGSGSWIVVSRETGRPILETFERNTAEAVNQDKYDVLTARRWLEIYNRLLKANGMEPTPEQVSSAIARPRPEEPQMPIEAPGQAEVVAAPTVAPEGVTPVSEQMQPAHETRGAVPSDYASPMERAAKERSAMVRTHKANGEPLSLLGFLRANGGLKPSGELTKLGITKEAFPALIRNNGNDHSVMADLLSGTGYLPYQDPSQPKWITADHMYDLLKDDLFEGRKAAPGGANPKAVAKRISEERFAEQQQLYAEAGNKLSDFDAKHETTLLQEFEALPDTLKDEAATRISRGENPDDIIHDLIVREYNDTLSSEQDIQASAAKEQIFPGWDDESKTGALSTGGENIARAGGAIDNPAREGANLSDRALGRANGEDSRQAATAGGEQGQVAPPYRDPAHTLAPEDAARIRAEDAAIARQISAQLDDEAWKGGWEPRVEGRLADIRKTPIEEKGPKPEFYDLAWRGIAYGKPLEGYYDGALRIFTPIRLGKAEVRVGKEHKGDGWRFQVYQTGGYDIDPASKKSIPLKKPGWKVFNLHPFGTVDKPSYKELEGLTLAPPGTPFVVPDNAGANQTAIRDVHAHVPFKREAYHGGNLLKEQVEVQKATPQNPFLDTIVGAPATTAAAPYSGGYNGTYDRLGRKIQAPGRQDWSPGNKVDVGFLKGLTVVGSIPARGDEPAQWLLRSDSGAHYLAQPHGGVTKVSEYEVPHLIKVAQ